MRQSSALKIAVIGTGISGLSAAWLLSQRHNVTVYDQASRAGGHANTTYAWFGQHKIPVDTGFIVFNRTTYPNFAALLGHFGVSTHVSDMSFAVSLREGALEYSGSDLRGLFAQKRNLIRPRFWSMLWDLGRFYRNAVRDAGKLGLVGPTLGEYLNSQGYREAFCDDHLLPMASAIWSAPVADLRSFPALPFIRFQENHGLLQIFGRPKWETVSGGSISYVRRLTEAIKGNLCLGVGITSVRRCLDGVEVTNSTGHVERFDHVVIASHADEALAMLADPTPLERTLLEPFRYRSNRAVLHSDPSLMPRRRTAWASWNYVENSSGDAFFTYWMNRLQGIPEKHPLFVTLNPPREPAKGTIHRVEIYDHPVFTTATIDAQRRLWRLQGRERTWFCGAYFGSGFHEDGLQAGLAVAEELGELRRPWQIASDSSRICRDAIVDRLPLGVSR